MKARNDSCVYLEALQQGRLAVVQKLDDAIVEGGQNPWALRVERQTLHTMALALELYQLHGHHGEWWVRGKLGVIVKVVLCALRTIARESYDGDSPL